MRTLREVFRIMVRQWVNNPDAVDVVKIDAEGAPCTYLIKVAPEDVGFVVGKRGAHITALRDYAKPIFSRRKVRAHIEVTAID